jgi:hypothetical protein
MIRRNTIAKTDVATNRNDELYTGHSLCTLFQEANSTLQLPSMHVAVMEETQRIALCDGPHLALLIFVVTSVSILYADISYETQWERL